jgi:hypothetical protein
LNEIEETFRNPNIQIEAIQDMQQQQEESLKDIQLKLDEMNQVEEILKITNGFKPYLYSFSGNSTFLFGSLKVNEFRSYMNSFKSIQILKGEQQSFDLIKLCEFSPNDKFTLLYRGTRDGFGSNDFHSKCDGHSNTLTILKAEQSSYIFGGFALVKWEWEARRQLVYQSMNVKDL